MWRFGEIKVQHKLFTHKEINCIKTLNKKYLGLQIKHLCYIQNIFADCDLPVRFLLPYLLRKFIQSTGTLA